MEDNTKFEEVLKLIKNKRVLVLIDGGNIYFSTHIKKLEIDYGLMLNQIKENSKDLVGMVFYTAFKPNEKKQFHFFDYLESVGLTVFKKPIKVFKNDVKGNLDVELTVDAIQKIKTYDALVLLSGDGDFTYLVKTLEEAKKTVLVFSFKGFTAHELMAEADNNYYLEDITKLWQSPKNSKPRPKIILDDLKIEPKRFFNLPHLPSIPNPLDLFKPRPKPAVETLPDVKNKQVAPKRRQNNNANPKTSDTGEKPKNSRNRRYPSKSKPTNEANKNPNQNSNSQVNKPTKVSQKPKAFNPNPIKKPAAQNPQAKPANRSNKTQTIDSRPKPNPQPRKKPQTQQTNPQTRNNYNKQPNNQNNNIADVQIHLE